MNMFKRFLAMILVLCMTFGVMPVTALANDSDQNVAGASAEISTDENYDAAVISDESETDEPEADEPKVDEPEADEPKVDEPEADEPKVDEPEAEEPKVDEPEAEEPKVDEPEADEPETDEPVTDETKTEESDELTPSTDTVQEETANDALNAVAEEEIEALANFEPTEVSLSYADTYRILHLDAGRKYFTVDWIKALINEMEAAGFTHLELAFGNDGLRFLLDDMAVGSYSDDQVTAAIKQGNLNYNNTQTTVPYAPSVNELTQSEMDAIIAHANDKGIKIIPLLNNPGHMNAIVSAASSLTGSSAGYNGSSSTVDLENTDAVNFVKGLVEKYVAYFDGKGCNEFNFGADEYANDVYSTGSMGFGALTYAGKYQLFVNYVNEMADMIKGYGMVPIAFNDGIYFNKDTTSYNFDTQIMVAFWTSGWSGYQSASASTMASKGHEMINVNGDYYYVLGKSDQWDTNGYTYAANWNNSAFMGSTVSDPMGGMFCIWCDYPGAETETQIAANTRMILRAMAAEMQGEDGTAVSDEVIPGGFNADGTIAEDCNNVTVKDDASSVEVTGCDLTSVTVTVVEDVPTIEGAAKVKAWDITPYAGTTKHEGKGTVKLPVPEDWDTNLVRGFYMENGSAVQVTGTPSDDYYTFDMPHFSVGGLMLLDATTQFDQEIELNVGDTHEIVIKDVDYNGEYATNPTGIATVVAVHEEKEGTGSVTPVATPNDGSDYYIINSNGKYMAANLNWVENISDAVMWRATYYYGYYMFSYNGAYLGFSYTTNSWVTTNNIYDNETELFISSGEFLEGDRSWEVITVATSTGSAAVNQSTITFTGIAPGTTYSTVGNTTYKIIVHDSVNITIKYRTADGTIIKTESATVRDDATTYTVSNFTHTDGTYYVVDNTTLNITPATVTEYFVTVTETEEDLTAVDPLTIEYWQTNAQVVATRGGSDHTKSVPAADAYSENGIELATVIPATGYKVDGSASDPDLGYWRTRLLSRETNEQTAADGDDETLNGTGITKVRYWNGSWAVYTDAGEWQNITLADYQLAAYYMNDMQLADEVSVSTSDWGKKGNGDFGGTYLGSRNVSLAFQIVYDGGTTSPAGTGVELAPYTYFVDHWGNRGVGTVAINQIGDYKIWKITAETGEHSVTYNHDYSPITVNGFTWDDNEMVVWEDERNPVSHYTILNPSNNPNTDGYYDNLRWNEQNESILIRIYLSTEETEDSLKVVYYDEKFDATLAEFFINVPNGSNFNNGIVQANTATSASLPAFAENDDRKDATGYGIVNALEKTQNFETNLANVAVTNNRYNPELYKYTGSVVSEDGKTITHYYTIDQTALSPNFVADFGLPLTFTLSDVVKDGIDTVQSVTVTPTTKFGTLSYDSATKEFTYTPTEILTTIDVLTISILFDGETTATTTNVGVTPATTVYYEESFVNWDNSWSGGNAAITVGNQAAETLTIADAARETTGKRYNYGYDPVYASTSGASNGTNATATAIGAKGTFTFTGNGIQVFANASESTGYVSVAVKNSSGKIVNLTMVDTVIKEGTTDATTGQTGTLSGLPVVSLVDLQNIEHDTYTVTITKVMDTEPVNIDGIRVFNTVKDSSIFLNDLEDKPNFYEMRDAVIHAIGLNGVTSDYETLYQQIYNEVAGATTLITDESVDYANNDTIQDLLDNGPKNELYLYAGQTLTFKVTTDRVMQLGLKAPQGSASYELNETAGTLNTTVDMFYTVANKGDATNGKVITVENTGNNILAVTLLKICDDPSFAFVPLSEADIKDILSDAAASQQPSYTMVELKGTDVLIDGTVFEYTGEPIEPGITVNVNGVQLVEGKDYSVTYTNNVEPGTATVTVRGIATASETLGYTGEVSMDYTITAPATPEDPEDNTKPEKPGKPEKPEKPEKPGNNKPGQTKATAELKIELVDYTGKKIGTAKLSAKGTSGDTCYFKAEEILKSAESKLPGKYAIADESAISGVETVYGESSTVTVLVGKVATLKITFVNLFGKKVGSATVTDVQSSGKYCNISAYRINAQAPSGRRGVWLLPAVIPYGSTASIVVPVI